MSSLFPHYTRLHRKIIQITLPTYKQIRISLLKTKIIKITLHANDNALVYTAKKGAKYNVTT